jgi:hypothetical protein
MTGSEFEPSISTLIRSSLSYFHRLLSRGERGKNLHNVRDINWHFYVSFVRLASQYDMPVEVVATFMRAINMHKYPHAHSERPITAHTTIYSPLRI